MQYTNGNPELCVESHSAQIKISKINSMKVTKTKNGTTALTFDTTEMKQMQCLSALISTMPMLRVFRLKTNSEMLNIKHEKMVYNEVSPDGVQGCYAHSQTHMQTFSWEKLNPKSNISMGSSFCRGGGCFLNLKSKVEVLNEKLNFGEVAVFSELKSKVKILHFWGGDVFWTSW